MNPLLSTVPGPSIVTRQSDSTANWGVTRMLSCQQGIARTVPSIVTPDVLEMLRNPSNGEPDLVWFVNLSTEPADKNKPATRGHRYEASGMAVLGTDVVQIDLRVHLILA